MRKRMILVSLLLLLAATAGRAETVESLPGYVPLEKLLLFPSDKVSVEINLVGPVLHMIAAGAQSDDPTFSAVVAGLRSIRLQVLPLKGMDAGAIKTRIGGAVHWLEAHGWASTMRVRDQGQETYLYLKESHGKVEGLTLLTFDPKGEAVAVNIVGRIDPAQLGSVAQGFHLPLQKLPASPGAKAETKKDVKKPE